MRDRCIMFTRDVYFVLAKSGVYLFFLSAVKKRLFAITLKTLRVVRSKSVKARKLLRRDVYLNCTRTRL